MHCHPTRSFFPKINSPKMKKGINFGNFILRSCNFQPNPPTHTQNKICRICLCEINPEHFLRIPICFHEFCRSCILSHIISQTTSNIFINIKCPTECSEIIPEDFIINILSITDALLRKYIKFNQIAKLNQDPNLRWCVTPGCNGYMIGETSNPKLVCGFCHKATCFLCRNPWHENLDCEAALDNEFKKYVKKAEVKECPKCHAKIEKLDGCNHITCTQCRYQFCWLCGRKYSRKHYKWYNFLFGCPGAQYRKKSKIGGVFKFVCH